MRRKLDQYFTPEKAVKQLLDNLPFELSGTIFEPCCGDGAIVNVLRGNVDADIYTNDLDLSLKADFHWDITDEGVWDHLGFNDMIPDFVITNPPFNKAHEIIPLAYKYCSKATIALLRLSWLEPCANRVEFLSKHPPNLFFSIPRISFTGDGNTDRVATAWFIWTKDLLNHSSIKVLGK